MSQPDIYEYEKGIGYKREIQLSLISWIRLPQRFGVGCGFTVVMKGSDKELVVDGFFNMEAAGAAREKLSEAYSAYEKEQQRLKP
jgi:hypothetical protein